MTATIAAIIPTRNRADLAIQAARSLLDQDAPIQVFLSDNSADPDPLSGFARTEPRVHYLRPERELRMSEHWDWAVRQAMARSAATHFTIHYDRKYSKPGYWRALADLVARQPDMLVTYAMDSITDEPPPLRLWQTPWTGRNFRVGAARVIALVSAGRVADCHQAIPILTNSVVPRAVLDRIEARFGDVCNSTTGDACFSARFLALEQGFLHHDRTIAVALAPHRSAAMGFLTGGGRDYDDWENLWGDRPWLDASPFPGLNLGQNMYFHEYELVRRATGDRLPPLDRQGCLEELGAALRWVRDDAKRDGLRAELERHGWTGNPSRLPGRHPLAPLRDQLLCFLIRRFGFVPPSVSGVAFADDEGALEYALRFPQRPVRKPDHLAALAPVELHSP